MCLVGGGWCAWLGGCLVQEVVSGRGDGVSGPGGVVCLVRGGGGVPALGGVWSRGGGVSGPGGVPGLGGSASVPCGIPPPPDQAHPPL